MEKIKIPDTYTPDYSLSAKEEKVRFGLWLKKTQMQFAEVEKLKKGKEAKSGLQE